MAEAVLVPQDVPEDPQGLHRDRAHQEQHEDILIPVQVHQDVARNNCCGQTCITSLSRPEENYNSPQFPSIFRRVTFTGPQTTQPQPNFSPLHSDFRNGVTAELPSFPERTNGTYLRQMFRALAERVTRMIDIDSDARQPWEQEIHEAISARASCVDVLVGGLDPSLFQEEEMMTRYVNFSYALLGEEMCPTGVDIAVYAKLFDRVIKLYTRTQGSFVFCRTSRVVDGQHPSIIDLELVADDLMLKRAQRTPN